MLVRKFIREDFENLKKFVDKEIPGAHCLDLGFNEHWFNPSKQKEWNIILLERDNDDIAGYIFYIKVPVWFLGKEDQILWISTGAVDEAARKKGEGIKLYLWLYRNHSLVGAMSGNKNSLPINSKLGLDVDEEIMRRYIYVNNMEKVIGLCPSDSKEELLKLRFSPIKNITYQSEVVTKIPEDYDSLWINFRKNLLLTVDKNSKYLAWRYIHSPYIKYTLISISSNQILQGFAIIRIQKTPQGNVARIMEMITLPDSSYDAWLSLLYYCQEARLIFFDFMVIGTIYDSILKRIGMIKIEPNSIESSIPHLLSPVEHRAWSNSFHIGGTNVRQDMSWRNKNVIYFTKGDSDRDWPTAFDIGNVTEKNMLRG